MDSPPAPPSDPQNGDAERRAGTVNELLSAVAGLRARFDALPASEAGSAPPGLSASDLATAEIDLSARQIEVLVALGVIRRLEQAGESRIVWAGGETRATGALAAFGQVAETLRGITLSPPPPPPPDVATVERLVAPAAGRTLAAGAGAGPAAARAAAVSRDEEFQIDLASDYEHERLLMYRVILAFEIVAGILLIREIAVRLV
jgi:hypothetical protein